MEIFSSPAVNRGARLLRRGRLRQDFISETSSSPANTEKFLKNILGDSGDRKISPEGLVGHRRIEIFRNGRRFQVL